MKQIVSKVEEQICSNNKSFHYFSITSILFPIWFIMNAFFYFLFLDMWNQILLGFQYIAIVISNFYYWRRMSSYPQLQILKPTLSSYIRYIFLIFYKEGKLIDKSSNLNLKYLILILQYLQNMTIHLSISQSKTYVFNQPDEDSEIHYQTIIFGFMLLSIGYQTYCNSEFIHYFSTDSRYRFQKSRNLLKYIFLFCTIFTSEVFDIIIPNIRGYIAIYTGIYFITNFTSAFWIAYYNPFELPVLTPFQKIYMKGMAIICLFILNLEIYVYPIYNKVISSYEILCNNKACRFYRLFTYFRILTFGLISYFFYNDYFTTINFYIPSLCLFGVYITSTFFFIFYDILQAIFPRILKVTLSQLTGYQQNIEGQHNNELNQSLINANSNDNFKEQKLAQLLQIKQKTNKLLQVIQINNDLQQIELVDKLIENILINILMENIKGDYLMCNINDYWFAKDGKNLVIILNNQNISIIINSLKNCDTMKYYQISLTITQEISTFYQNQLILALKQHIDSLVFYTPKNDNYSPQLIEYISSYKSLASIKFLHILAFNYHIQGYQLVHPVQILFDLFD